MLKLTFFDYALRGKLIDFFLWQIHSIIVGNWKRIVWIVGKESLCVYVVFNKRIDSPLGRKSCWYFLKSEFISFCCWSARWVPSFSWSWQGCSSLFTMRIALMLGGGLIKLYFYISSEGFQRNIIVIFGENDEETVAFSLIRIKFYAKNFGYIRNERLML